jgi:hypothetical protein
VYPSCCSDTLEDDFLDDFQDDYVDSDEEPSAKTKGGKGRDKTAGESVEPPPPSFSQVDLSRPRGEIAERFPLFPGVEAALEVVLEAGTWDHGPTSTPAFFSPPPFLA